MQNDARFYRGQGAIESSSWSTAGTLRAQGATEYLVLLAVVLIVALVSVALLGFFPGMASDAQITQSQAYWKGAQPISITEWDAKYYSATITTPYLRVRNSGAYPIRITKVLGAGGQSISQVIISALSNISDYYYLAPGEEKYFAYQTAFPAVSTNRDIDFYLVGGSSSGVALKAASSICSATGAGMTVMNDFGFEYIEYIEGQQITKRQVGRPLVIKCS